MLSPLRTTGRIPRAGPVSRPRLGPQPPWSRMNGPPAPILSPPFSCRRRWPRYRRRVVGVETSNDACQGDPHAFWRRTCHQFASRGWRARVSGLKRPNVRAHMRMSKPPAIHGEPNHPPLSLRGDESLDLLAFSGRRGWHRSHRGSRSTQLRPTNRPPRSRTRIGISLEGSGSRAPQGWSGALRRSSTGITHGSPSKEGPSTSLLPTGPAGRRRRRGVAEYRVGEWLPRSPRGPVGLAPGSDQFEVLPKGAGQSLRRVPLHG